MMDDRVERLLELVTESEKTELTVLNNAVVQNIKAYRADPSAANKRNWDAAQEGFQARVKELWEKYFQEGSSGAQEKLKNIPAVIDYLADQGWKISKSAAYKHKKEGKLRPGTDGHFSVKAVEKYAREWLEKRGGAESGAETLDAKAQAELEKLKAQARHWDTKTKIELGQYVPREDWDRELAARARVLKSDIENFIRTEAPEVIRLVGGDPEKAPDLIEYYLRQAETWMDRYSQEKTWRVNQDQ